MPRRFKSLKSPTQLRRAMAERRANERAAKRGEPLPFPNIWDLLDPTKVSRDATEEQFLQSVSAFRKLCRPPVRKRHYL